MSNNLTFYKLINNIELFTPYYYVKFFKNKIKKKYKV